MKKTTRLKYGKHTLQELIIPGVKTYYQISKGKKRMATYVNEKEATENFDHLVMHGSLKHKALNSIGKSDSKEEEFKTYTSPDGHEVIVIEDEFEIYKDGELILDGVAPADDPKKIYQMAKRSGQLD